MRCLRIDIRRSLAAYVHGELPARKIKRIEDHLLDCQDCRVGLSRLQVGHRIAGQLTSAVSAADPWSAIEKAIDSTPPPETAGESVPTRRVRAFRVPLPMAVSIAGVALLAAAIVFAVRNERVREAFSGETLDLSEFHPVSVTEMERNAKPHVVAEGYVSEVGLNDEDGDLSFKLVDDLHQRDPFIVCEIIDPIKLAAPTVGSRVRVYGVSRYDGQENHNWYEVHPVLNIEVVNR